MCRQATGAPNAADDPRVNVRHTPVTGNNETSSLGLLMCKDLKESNKGDTFIGKGSGQSQKLALDIFIFLFFFPDAAMFILSRLVLLRFLCRVFLFCLFCFGFFLLRFYSLNFQ